MSATLTVGAAVEPDAVCDVATITGVADLAPIRTHSTWLLGTLATVGGDLDDADTTALRYTATIKGDQIRDRLLAGVERDDWLQTFAEVLSDTTYPQHLSDGGAHLVAGAAVTLLDEWLGDVIVTGCDFVTMVTTGLPIDAQLTMLGAVRSLYPAVEIEPFRWLVHLPSPLLGYGFYAARSHKESARWNEGRLDAGQLTKIGELWLSQPDMFATFAEFVEVGARL